MRRVHAECVLLPSLLRRCRIKCAEPSILGPPPFLPPWFMLVTTSGFFFQQPAAVGCLNETARIALSGRIVLGFCCCRR
jgi:hypothetical protein